MSSQCSTVQTSSATVLMYSWIRHIATPETRWRCDKVSRARQKQETLAEIELLQNMHWPGVHKSDKFRWKSLVVLAESRWIALYYLGQLVENALPLWVGKAASRHFILKMFNYYLQNKKNRKQKIHKKFLTYILHLFSYWKCSISHSLQTSDLTS